jgi:hypothetical protein
MTGRFNLQDYETVEDRNAKFWAKYPTGRIVTELVFHDGTRYVFRCEAFTNREDDFPAATGYAEELVTERGVNSTSALENCETSAEGRALARLGFAAKGARPSREEMEKVQRLERSPADVARARLKTVCAENGWDLTKVASLYEGDLKTEADPNAIEAFAKGLAVRPDAELKAPV